MPRTRASVLNDRARAQRDVGQRLAAGRRHAGLSQAEAARRLGVPQSQIAKLELGRRQLNLLEGLRLVEIYGISVAELDPRAEPIDRPAQ